MPRTISSWIDDLIRPGTVSAYLPEIVTFTLWCRDHISASGKLPFEYTPWYLNGHCIMHNDLRCRRCEYYFGGCTKQHEWLISPPSDLMPVTDAWEHFRRTWSSMHGRVRQQPASDREQKAFDRNARGERHGRRSPRAAASRDESPRRISVPVWSSSRISASPAIAADELYVFPSTSRRVKLVDMHRSVARYLRLPEMSVADVIGRLLLDPHRQELRVAWYDGRDKISRILRSSTNSIHEELKELCFRPDGRRIFREPYVERWLEIRDVI